MSGHSVQSISDGAEVTGVHQALVMNIRFGSPFFTSISPLTTLCSAAKSLMDLLRTNLGPRGTLKMLVGGAGDIKLTKVELFIFPQSLLLCVCVSHI